MVSFYKITLHKVYEICRNDYFSSTYFAHAEIGALRSAKKDRVLSSGPCFLIGKVEYFYVFFNPFNKITVLK